MALSSVTPTKMTPCQQCPLRTLKSFRQFESGELEFVWSFKTAEFTAAPQSTILAEGETSPHLYTVLSGWGFRYKTLADGRRQILNFILPGDLIGLQSVMTGVMTHSVESITQTVLCVFPREKLWALYEKHPSLAFDVTWLASREERLLDEHLLSVGRRSATERVGFLLLSLYYRAQQAGIATEKRALMPLTQQHLADALGLSIVHTNKVIKKLTDLGVMSFKNSLFELKNEQVMREICWYGEKEPAPRPFI
jgi:CRP-like cAMP-binding protein